MRVFKNKWFTRFARRQGMSDRALSDAVDRAERGLIDADLGGGVIKQRIARPHEGKSGGFRSVVLFRQGERALFVYAYPKSARDNIDPDEVKAFKQLAQLMLGFSDGELLQALKEGVLTEVSYEKSDDESQHGKK